MLIYPRSTWNPQYSDGDISLSGEAVEVFAHHTVGAQLSPNASMEEECREMRNLEAIGHSRFSTPEAPNFGISYNVIIFPSGRAYQGVSFNRRGAHTDGRNSTVRSICFAGNYETNRPTQAALETAQAIYHEGKGKWWTESAPLRGHRDLKPTACPGRYVYDQLDFIRTAPVIQEGIFTMLSDAQQKELYEWVKELHEGTAPKINMPWEDKPGVKKKYTVRSALAWIADQVWKR